MSNSAAAVANSFLELAQESGFSLTNMQVQKLVFFAHGVHLAGFGEPLIHEHPRAWTFGPVIPELYEELRKYGSSVVTEKLKAPDSVESDTGKRAISATWRAYQGYSAGQLSKISHIKNGPWDSVWNAPDGKGRFGLISDSVIRDYYLSRVKTKEISSVA